MIRRILDELAHGPTTTGELARKLGIEQGALEEMLRFMAGKGLIRPLRPDCRAQTCAGCACADWCASSPVSGYELVGVEAGRRYVPPSASETRRRNGY